MKGRSFSWKTGLREGYFRPFTPLKGSEISILAKGSKNNFSNPQMSILSNFSYKYGNGVEGDWNLVRRVRGQIERLV